MCRTKLRGSEYVTPLWDGEALLAANAGEVWRLDPERGEVLWHNRFAGMGRGLVSLASSRRPSATADTDLAAQTRRRQAAASAGV